MSTKPASELIYEANYRAQQLSAEVTRLEAQLAEARDKIAMLTRENAAMADGYLSRIGVTAAELIALSDNSSVP